MRGLSKTTTTIETYGKKKKKASILDWIQFIAFIIFAIIIIYYFGPYVGPMLLQMR